MVKKTRARRNKNKTLKIVLIAVVILIVLYIAIAVIKPAIEKKSPLYSGSPTESLTESPCPSVSECSSDSECDDGEVCTQDRCDMSNDCLIGTCVNTRITNCCHTNTDCDDYNRCTTDTCSETTNKCSNKGINTNDGCCEDSRWCGGECEGLHMIRDTICENNHCIPPIGAIATNCPEGTPFCQEIGNRAQCVRQIY